MILIGFPKAEVDKSVLDDIRKGRVGSIIFFEKNIPSRNSFVELKKMTWTYQKAAPIPLIIAIDQEGGRVNRMKEKYGFPKSISAAQAGTMPLDSVRFYAEATAATLVGVGINMNFAPVVDLAANPTNPVIVKPERAYSANPDSVILFAREYVLQHKKVGVLTALKHFPGHGSSKDDTHLGVADVTGTWTDAELTPYRELIKEGLAESVMTAHIVNKKLDAAGNPGTLSKAMIQGILRDKLGYKGVVFTDDMQMHAIEKHYGLEEAIRLSILAGVDILTFSNNISGSQDRTVDRVHTIIRGMVEDGTIPKKRIDESFRRIMDLKSRLTQQQSDYYRELYLQQKAIAEENARIARENEKLAQEYRQQLKELENSKPAKKRKSNN